MKQLLAVVFASITLIGCSSPNEAFTYPPGAMLPFEAIQRAAYTAPKHVEGLFYLQVQATGVEDGTTYLNSEQDYRDQRNLTIAVSPAATKALEATLGTSLEAALQGKKLLVRGAARRVKIVILVNGEPTSKYYYQTQVLVGDPAQIAVQGGG